MNACVLSFSIIIKLLKYLGMKFSMINHIVHRRCTFSSSSAGARERSVMVVDCTEHGV